MSINTLSREIEKLRKTQLAARIEGRLSEFKRMGEKGNDEWFCELCFCILTANSKAKTALCIQEELGHRGFLNKRQGDLARTIRRNKHRFHNTKAGYIVSARKHSQIKDVIREEKDPRRWLVKNVKGLGWKEASHFLRNVGYLDYAIIDRHVISILHQQGIIRGRPKTLNMKTYLATESRLGEIAKHLGMSQGELDLYLWYMKTGEVLK